MRIVFMGSAALACASLDAVVKDPNHQVVGVVTQPDRPRGRDLRVQPCELCAHAMAAGLPLLTPGNVNAAGVVAELTALKPDIVIVVAFGQMLKSAVLTLPPLGCVNVHASLLPKYRGAAPVQWALANGETSTGVTTMCLNEKMDEGDILLQRALPIREEDTAPTLQARLALAGAELLSETLALIRKGTVKRIPQNSTLATTAPRLKKDDGRLMWKRSAVELHNRIRGFLPWPGCFFELPGAPSVRVRVLKSRVEVGQGEPGVLLQAQGDGPLVMTGKSALRLLEVQPAGRKPMEGAAFLRGYRLEAGARLV